MKNRYIIRSKITEIQFQRILRGFAKDITATQMARQTGLTSRSVNDILKKIRLRIAEEHQPVSPEERPDAQLRLRKFRGISGSTLDLHLRECTFRKQHAADSIYSRLLRMFRKRPLEPFPLRATPPPQS